ncbi:MAG: response regulator [Spirochaetia bacterium]
MRKVILVDDEPGVVEGLSVLIKWEDFGFEVAGTAEDGPEALELIREVAPDLVVTDIRMPEMDGLELIKQAKSCCAAIPRFLIISGHRDFNYAKKALTLGVDDYVLKPVYEENLTDVLNTIIQKLEKASSLIEEPVRLNEMLDGTLDPSNDLLTLCEEGCFLVWGTIDNFSLLEKEDIELSKERLGRFMTRILKLGTNVGIAENTVDCIRTVVSIPQLQKLYGSPEVYMQKLSSIISTVQGPTYSFIYSPVLSCLSEIKVWWQRTPRLRELILSLGPGAIVKAEELWNRGADNITYFKSGQILLDSIANGNLDKIKSILSENARSAIDIPLEPALVLNYVKKMCFEMYRLVTELNGNPANIDELLLLCRKDLKYVCIRTIFSILQESAAATASYLQTLDKIRPSTRMQHIKQDLMQSFTQDITISELAHRHGISPAYLGQLFRKEYGESFKDYRNRLRIEEAARLLRKTDLRIYEIAQRVGYQSTDYFERRFSAFYATTPSAYRAEVAKNTN